jgi:crescentin
MPVNSAWADHADEANVDPGSDTVVTQGRPSATIHSMADTLPAALWEEERRLLNQFMQQQFALLNQTREQLLVETRQALSAEKARLSQELDERQREVERQAQVLALRVQEVQKREARLADLEDAIPERLAHGPAVDSQPGDGASTFGPPDKTVIQEFEALRRQVEKREEERNAAQAEVQRLQQENQQLLRTRTEQDLALVRLRRQSIQPPEWTKLEREFADQHRQLEADRKQLADQIQQLRQFEKDQQQKAELADKALAAKEQQLQRAADELAALRQRLHEERQQFKEQSAELSLREAELREMSEIADRDHARERAELHQERLRIARLREALRLEQVALRSQTEPSRQTGERPAAAACPAGAPASGGD